MGREFLSPTDVEKLKKEKKVIVDNNFEPDDDYGDEPDEPSEDSNVQAIRSEKKYVNNAGKVKVDFETLGRFNTPPTAFFSDYTISNIDGFAVVTEDNIFETMVAVLEDLKSPESNFKVSNMLVEEFFEVLIALKAQFNTILHTHRWYCEQPDCEAGVLDKKTIQERIINLGELQYLSIEQADDEYRNIMRDAFKNTEYYEMFLKRKYGVNAVTSEYDPETEVNQIQIKEPLSFTDNLGNIYKLKFTRMCDVIDANKYIQSKYNPKIKMIKNKTIHGKNPDELKQIKEEEMAIVNQAKNKDLISAVKATSLIEYNGHPLTNITEKLEVYSKIPAMNLIDFHSFLNEIKFGVNHKSTFECSVCGHVEERSLQREFNFMEFIPVKSNTNDGLRDITRGHIFMGI